MMRLLLAKAFILLAILSFENEQQHSISFVSATPLQRFKMKHEPPNEELNGTSQKTNESQFDGVPRVRRSNSKVDLNTEKNGDNDTKDGNAIILPLVLGFFGIIIFIWVLSCFFCKDRGNYGNSGYGGYGGGGDGGGGGCGGGGGGGCGGGGG